MRRRLRRMREQWAQGDVEWEEIAMRINSWIGHAQHGRTWRVRAHLFDRFPFNLSEGKRDGLIH